MKKLILVRHAKAAWKNPDLTDYERQLNERGVRDAIYMSELFAKKDIKPDLIQTSGAVRSLTTAYYFADALKYEKEKINVDEGLYFKGSKYILNLLKQIPENIDSLLLFGHNPDMTSLASYFTGEYFENVPTCGIVGVEFDFENWEQIENTNGKLLFFDYPKKFITK